QCRTVYLRYNIGNRERLPRARRTKQCLMSLPGFHLFNDFFNRFGLIAAGLIICHQFKLIFQTENLRSFHSMNLFYHNNAAILTEKRTNIRLETIYISLSILPDMQPKNHSQRVHISRLFLLEAARIIKYRKFYRKDVTQLPICENQWLSYSSPLSASLPHADKTEMPIMNLPAMNQILQHQLKQIWKSLNRLIRVIPLRLPSLSPRTGILYQMPVKWNLKSGRTATKTQVR